MCVYAAAFLMVSPPGICHPYSLRGGVPCPYKADPHMSRGRWRHRGLLFREVLADPIEDSRDMTSLPLSTPRNL